MNAFIRERIRRIRREAEGYLELGMPELSLRALERQARLVRSDARGSYLMGESLRELERYREAIFPLRRSLDLIPDDIHVRLALGWCYKRIGRLRQAIESLEKALEVEPGEGILHYNLACYWSLANDPYKALQYLASALDIDGNFRELVFGEPDFEPLHEDPLFQSLTGTH